MEIYIVTRSTICLEDGFYDEETRDVAYKRKTEWFETKEKAFVSYIKAAKYIRELLIEENEHTEVFSEEDMNRWSVFFIGFHHGCKLHYINPRLIEYCKCMNMIPPSHLVEYKIEAVSVDYEMLDEREEIMKGLA